MLSWLVEHVYTGESAPVSGMSTPRADGEDRPFSPPQSASRTLQPEDYGSPNNVNGVGSDYDDQQEGEMCGLP